MRQTYHPVSVLWHWLIAILLVATYYFVLGRPDTPGPSPEKLQMMSYHKWAGITVLFFSLIRIATRLIFPAPPLGADVHMPAWQNKAHKLTLLLMLLLTLAIPLGGWLMSSAAGRPVVMFGLWQLPDLIGVNKDLAGQIKEVHETAAWALLALAGLHTAAALKHYFVDKDSVLGRMLPFLAK